MRQINKIVIHCSATREGDTSITADTIDAWHKARGWKGIGYHFIINIDGSIESGREIKEVGAHAYGHNADSIGIVYIGGLNKKGKPKDTRTIAQKMSMNLLVEVLKGVFPEAEVLGHRDLSPDVDGDGIVEPWEWTKACPCFNAKKEYGG